MQDSPALVSPNWAQEALHLEAQGEPLETPAELAELVAQEAPMEALAVAVGVAVPVGLAATVGLGAAVVSTRMVGLGAAVGLMKMVELGALAALVPPVALAKTAAVRAVAASLLQCQALQVSTYHLLLLVPILVARLATCAMYVLSDNTSQSNPPLLAEPPLSPLTSPMSAPSPSV